MRRLWNFITSPVTHHAYWEGVEAGMGLGRHFTLDHVEEVIRDLFVDLPDTTFTVSKPVELGEYIIREIRGKNDD